MTPNHVALFTNLIPARFDCPMNSQPSAIPDRNSWRKATIVHGLADWSLRPTGSRLFPLYDRSVRIKPSPVVQLRRAVAIALRDGLDAGLTHIDAVLEHGDPWGFANQGFLYSLADPVFG
jgi:hypothetical protein